MARQNTTKCSRRHTVGRPGEYNGGRPVCSCIHVDDRPIATPLVEVLRGPLEPCQYTSIRFTEHLALEGIDPSIGTVGDAYDNGLMESIIGLFKTECIATTVFHDGPYKTLADVEYATAGWVDWYNHRRLHGTLGMRTPAEHEQANYAALNPEPHPP